LGIGRTEKHDPASRTRKRSQAFATCVSSVGRFGFVSIYPEVQEDQIPESLRNAVVSALGEAEKLNLPYDSIVIHLTGDLKIDERKAVEAAVKKYKPQNTPVICILSVSDRADYFAVSDQNPQGLASRGQVIRIARDEYLLFTEGMEDLGSARFRTPCSVKIKIRYMPDGVDPSSLVAQVYDLAQVNFRAFNGASKPISVLYSELIARAIQTGDFAAILASKPELTKRMWFL
jgi:argonaute-like protein implicated in RNA metabolism and viral defense